MKKVVLTLAILFSATAVFTSCRETEKETVIKEVETSDDDDDGGILERAGKKADEEVNEEIDEEIENIGDDN